MKGNMITLVKPTHLPELEQFRKSTVLFVGGQTAAQALGFSLKRMLGYTEELCPRFQRATVAEDFRGLVNRPRLIVVDLDIPIDELGRMLAGAGLSDVPVVCLGHPSDSAFRSRALALIDVPAGLADWESAAAVIATLVALLSTGPEISSLVAPDVFLKPIVPGGGARCRVRVPLSQNRWANRRRRGRRGITYKNEGGKRS